MSYSFECGFFFIGSLFVYCRPFAGFWSPHNVVWVCALLLTWCFHREGRTRASQSGFWLPSLLSGATVVNSSPGIWPLRLAPGALCTCLILSQECFSSSSAHENPWGLGVNRFPGSSPSESGSDLSVEARVSMRNRCPGDAHQVALKIMRLRPL